jgi:hypothetical protein
MNDTVNTDYQNVSFNPGGNLAGTAPKATDAQQAGLQDLMKKNMPNTFISQNQQNIQRFMTEARVEKGLGAEGRAQKAIDNARKTIDGLREFLNTNPPKLTPDEIKAYKQDLDAAETRVNATARELHLK